MTDQVPEPDDVVSVSPDLAGPNEIHLPAGSLTPIDEDFDNAREVVMFSKYDMFEKDFRLLPADTVVPELEEPVSPEEEEEIGLDPKGSSAPESVASSVSSESSATTPTEESSPSASGAVQASPASVEKDSGKPKASGKSGTPTS